MTDNNLQQRLQYVMTILNQRTPLSATQQDVPDLLLAYFYIDSVAETIKNELRRTITVAQSRATPTQTTQVPQNGTGSPSQNGSITRVASPSRVVTPQVASPGRISSNAAPQGPSLSQIRIPRIQSPGQAQTNIQTMAVAPQVIPRVPSRKSVV